MTCLKVHCSTQDGSGYMLCEGPDPPPGCSLRCYVTLWVCICIACLPTQQGITCCRRRETACCERR